MKATLRSLLGSLVLPREITAFERQFLGRINRVAMLFFILHLPALSILAAFNDTGPVLAIILSLAVIAVPFAASYAVDNPRTESLFHGFTAMMFGALLVHFGQGPAQIEMHFYFFALIAMSSVYGNPMVIVVAALTVAIHHGLFWLVLPRSVFNYDAPFWVVIVHMGFVVFESIAAIYIARSFFSNFIGLERTVLLRTREVAAKNRDMRLVLDHVGQGLLMIDRHGRIAQQRSRRVEELLGTVGPLDFAGLLGRHSRHAGELFRVAWDEVVTGCMPYEVSMDVLPKRIVLGARTCKLDYTPILRKEELAGCLVVITDITAEVAREKLEAEQRDVIALLDRIAVDRSGVLEFFEESAAQIQRAIDGDSSITTIRRAVHTVKGNAGIVGLSELALTCHDLESQMAEERTISLPLMSRLAEVFTHARDRAESILSASDLQNVEVETSELDGLIEACKKGEPHDLLAVRLAAWKLEPIAKRLHRIAEQTRELATKLDKPRPRIVVDDGGIRLSREGWATFWAAFVHLVRNAMDHGIEDAEARVDAGKPPEGHLVLSASSVGGDLVIEVADDGRGIDWDAVASKAALLGLPTGNHAALVEALFAPGVSTATAISEVSGRGLGMSAMRAACLAKGGRIEVISSRGAGTRVRLILPSAPTAQPISWGVAARTLAKVSLSPSTSTPPTRLH